MYCVWEIYYQDMRMYEAAEAKVRTLKPRTLRKFYVQEQLMILVH